MLRHLESQWNQENRFSGWVDVPLSKQGILMTNEVAQQLAQFKIDVVYTSPLIRNTDTVLRVLAFSDKYPIFIHLDKGKMKDRGNFTATNKNYIPAYVSENLNERYYGNLQGLDKEETIKKYGPEQVKLWRRGFNNDPPGGGEGLDEVYKRAVPFYQKYIEKDLKQGENVLVIASHNSLRALVKYIENISDKDIINLEIPIGSVKIYEK